MAKVKIKAGGKIIILALIAVLMFIGYKFGAPYIIPQGKGQQDISGLMASSNGLATGTSHNGNKCINIGVVTWPGYAGGQYWNNGFKDNANSKYHQNGICVNFSVMDDFTASRAAFKSGAMDLMWVTVDAFPTESGNYGENVKFLFQADWSRGGDAIVTKGNVNSVVDLQGSKIAVAEGTPSHTFLLWMLDMGGLNIMSDVNIIKVPSAIDAASDFKAGKVDAAVVWSPDDTDCVKTVKGSKILVSTKQAANIIADGFMVKESYYNTHKTELQKLVEGWLQGSAEINSSDTAKQKAAQILSEGLQNLSKDSALASLDNVRLTTFGDNKNFFGLNSSYTGVTGQIIYEKMTKVYSRLNLAKNSLPWSTIVDNGFINSLKVSGEVIAEAKPTFTTPTQNDVTAPAVASKPVKISFAHGSVMLDENAQNIIDQTVVDQLKAFPTSRIRIEGNTDKTGSDSVNIQISRQRAQTMVDYLVKQHGFDANRFIVVGNGSKKPVCSEENLICLAKNRRTEFQILTSEK